MQAFSEPPPTIEMPLQLLLFVDKRPSSKDRMQQIRTALQTLREGYPFELQIVDVGEQPYLAEHFRLVATPALIKLHPEPRQTLTGNDLIAQLQYWWIDWQRSAEEFCRIANRPPVKPIEVQLNQLQTVDGTAAIVPETTPQETAIVQPAPTIPSTNINSINQSSQWLQLSDEVFRLQREKAELEHQLKFKDQIISMLAHDLRNPLTAAAIAVETLEMGHDVERGWTTKLTPALTAQLLNHARSQTKAIDRMITDILQAARGSNAEMRIQPQKLDLKHLCLDVLESLQDRFQAKSHHVKQDVPADLPWVLADGERVRQVLTNLLDNAIKYTPIGGAIELSALHRTTQKVQVSVYDNGLGIPPENQQRIFEDRYRLKRDEAKDGYGIGLSLCQRIIRAHYGQIWVDSTPNQGSCFHFTLPVFQL
jgi:two-component system clock-associated histidine kinase SasA